jgi:hypothetical protein
MTDSGTEVGRPRAAPHGLVSSNSDAVSITVFLVNCRNRPSRMDWPCVLLSPKLCGVPGNWLSHAMGFPPDAAACAGRRGRRGHEKQETLSCDQPLCIRAIRHLPQVLTSPLNSSAGHQTCADAERGR